MLVMENNKKRLSYEEALSITYNFFDESQNLSEYGWVRIGESKDGKYWADTNLKTADHRIVEKETNEVVWSYYEDFYF